jgi:hypothetical protein
LPAANLVPEDYPTNDITGNDDTEVIDELNDPGKEAPGGIIGAEDSPLFPVVRDAGGQLHDTLEFHFQFGEFVRVQIGNKWYRSSDFRDWRHHVLLKHNGQTWVDNGSVADMTNNGW